MRILTPDHLQQIDRILGRPLTDEDTAQVPSLKDLTASATAIARSIAVESRMLATKYLLELVPRARLSVVATFVEAVLEGGLSVEQWAAQHPDA